MNLDVLRPYSLLLVAAALLVIVALLLFRQRPRLPELLAFLGLTAGLVLVYLYIRPVQTPLMGAAADVQGLIGQGQPVLLEFQSPYCIACTQVKPKVDQLEAEFKDELLVIRLNIQEQVGKDLAPLYGFEFTPTFIFFDAQGQEVWRSVGGLDEARLRSALGKK